MCIIYLSCCDARENIKKKFIKLLFFINNMYIPVKYIMLYKEENVKCYGKET